MTRVWMSILAFIEMAVGVFGLVAAVNLYFAHNAGMVMIFWPILVMMACFCSQVRRSSYAGRGVTGCTWASSC